MGKGKIVEKPKIEVELTEGYQKRFTAAVLKIYAGRVRREAEEKQEKRGA